MKKAALFILLLFVVFVSRADPGISFSKPIDDISSVYKTLMLKNGNTLLFQFKHKKGIDVTLYNKTHEPVYNDLIEGENFNSKSFSGDDFVIDGLFEIKGNAILLFSEIVRNTPTLFRVIISGETGKELSEEKLLEAEPYAAWYGYGMHANGSLNHFIVAKDPNSDNYGVAIQNKLIDPFKANIIRFRAYHYNGDNKEISHADFDPNNTVTAKCVLNVGIAVNGDKELFLYAFSSDKPVEAVNREAGRLTIAKLTAGDNKLTYGNIGSSLKMKDTRGFLSYNSKVNSLELLTLTSNGNDKSSTLDKRYENSYSCAVLEIDPVTLAVKRKSPNFRANITEEQSLVYKTNQAMLGMVNNFTTNDDGSATVLTEQVINRDATMVRKGIKKEYVSLQTLGNIQLMKWTDSQFVQKYTIDKCQNTYESPYRTASYDYINGGNGEYLLFNDMQCKIVHSLGTIKQYVDGNLAVVSIHNGQVQKTFPLGQPGDGEGYRFCDLYSASYCNDLHTYSMVVIDGSKKDLSYRIAWIDQL